MKAYLDNKLINLGSLKFGAVSFIRNKLKYKPLGEKI